MCISYVLKGTTVLSVVSAVYAYCFYHCAIRGIFNTGLTFFPDLTNIHSNDMNFIL